MNRKTERQSSLRLLYQMLRLFLSPLLRLPDWTALARLREPSPQSGVQGFWLKHIDAVYGGASAQALSLWWHCKIEPMRMHGILLYAQAGRSSQARTDYTFAVWNRPPPSAAQAQAVLQAIARREALPERAAGTDLALQPLQLVTFAKACSGLTQAQLAYVDSVVRKTTVDKFGPVRSLQPTLVLELGFEGIHRSLRHKSGVVLRSPCMLRICPDKALHEAGSLDDLQRLLALRGGAASESAADALPGAASGDENRPSSP